MIDWFAQVWDEEGWAPKESLLPENQVQGKQSQVSWAKGEEGESKNQQNCENQLRWGEEEESDGKQGDGVSWQEWKQQESDDQAVPGSLPSEEENEEENGDGDLEEDFNDIVQQLL